MSDFNFYSDIPTWDNGTWTTTHFDTQDQFRDFLLPLFKEPGKYEFDATSNIFNEQAKRWTATKRYCQYVEGSRDFIKYWEDQKAKCRFGVIFKNGDKTWYLTRTYYMWINFLPINDKVKKRFGFVDVWDSQYHMALYELLAELHYMHVAIVKKRQFGSSYFHTADLINQLWFEETPILKMGASLKKFINEEGSWRFLDEYKSHLDRHTAWYRPMDPWKTMIWQQQIEDTDTHGRTTMVGLKGVIQGISLEQSPTNGVGGACRVFYYEEAGIAPSMDKTVEYLFPAMELGFITTGIFKAAGSVGELEKCEPLKKMMYFPKAHRIYPVRTNLMDEKGTVGDSGLFIPEQWSMPPFIDEFGNSQVEAALEALNERFTQWKKELDPATYQLRVSQHPRNLAEAFDWREASIFPMDLVNAQTFRIEDKTYPTEYIDLSRNAEGVIIAKPTTKLPISEWPIPKTLEDKTGVLVVYERPPEKPEWGMFYASVDPVSQGKTTTSESLCSIYIYKNPVEVTRIDGDKVESFLEHDKVVAQWVGRFDDLNKTHERLELIIEWFNAWTVVENNISLFIQYMIANRKQKYLVPKDQMLMFKDLSPTMNVNQEYGWRNSGTVFPVHILNYYLEYLTEVIDTVTTEDGTIVKRTYGIERIPDIMVMKEMRGYEDGANVDRLVALAALIAFAKVQQANRGYTKRVETTDKKYLEKSKNLYKLEVSPFRHVGKISSGTGINKPIRMPYKNIR